MSDYTRGQEAMREAAKEVAGTAALMAVRRSWSALQVAARVEAAIAALPLAPEGGDAKLSCDVLVAPATVIRKGTKMSTLMLALSMREAWDAPPIERHPLFPKHASEPAPEPAPDPRDAELAALRAEIAMLKVERDVARRVNKDLSILLTDAKYETTNAAQKAYAAGLERDAAREALAQEREACAKMEALIARTARYINYRLSAGAKSREAIEAIARVLSGHVPDFVGEVETDEASARSGPAPVASKESK